MPKGKKKHLIEEKHPIEMTTDEAMEYLFGKEVRDKLRELVREVDSKAKKSSHERSVSEV